MNIVTYAKTVNKVIKALEELQVYQGAHAFDNMWEDLYHSKLLKKVLECMNELYKNANLNTEFEVKEHGEIYQVMGETKILRINVNHLDRYITKLYEYNSQIDEDYLEGFMASVTKTAALLISKIEGKTSWQN